MKLKLLLKDGRTVIADVIDVNLKSNRLTGSIESVTWNTGPTHKRHLLYVAPSEIVGIMTIRNFQHLRWWFRKR